MLNSRLPAAQAGTLSQNSPHSSAPNPPCSAKQISVNQPKYWNVPPTAFDTGCSSAASRGMESVYATLTPAGALTAFVTQKGKPNAFSR